jgi:predicted O-methyltransferase YrrM
MDFCPELLDLIQTRRAIGQSGKVFENVWGHSTENNLVVLRSLMREMNAQSTLETGFAFGGSCLLFTSTHRELAHPAAAQHVAIDPMQTRLFDSAGLLRVGAAGLSGYLDFRGESSSMALPQLLREGRQFDLIYIDGSHVFEGVLVDAYYCARLLRDGGVMLFDDSALDQVAKVVRFVRRNQAYCLTEVDLTAHRRDAGFRYRAARMLGRVQLTAFRRTGSPDRDEWRVPLVDF